MDTKTPGDSHSIRSEDTGDDVSPREYLADAISMKANMNIRLGDVNKDIKATNNIKNINRGEDDIDNINVKLKATHLKSMQPSEKDFNVNIKPREGDTSVMPNGPDIKVNARKSDIDKNSVINEKQTDGNKNIKSDSNVNHGQLREDHNKRKSKEIGMNVKPSFMEQRLIERLFQFSKSGNLSQIKTIVEGKTL